MAKLWIGVDIGKAHHHVAAVDGDGRLVYSQRVANDETSSANASRPSSGSRNYSPASAPPSNERLTSTGKAR